MEENSKFKKIINRSVFSFITILIIAIIGLVILKYHVEGEQNMPFNLSDILVVSTAEGYQEKEKADNKWDVEVYQTNDVYLNIRKNKNYKDTQIIKNIEIKNIEIEEKPKVGDISIYVPDSEEQTYKYIEKNQVGTEITYEGDVKSDLKNLKISNQGGTIIFRIINKTGKDYTSNEDEIKHDGTLLNKVGITSSDLKFKISFDIIINLESDISFNGKITLDLPTGTIEKQGVTNLEKKDMNDIVFKRVNN